MRSASVDVSKYHILLQRKTLCREEHLEEISSKEQTKLMCVVFSGWSVVEERLMEMPPEEREP